MVDSILERVADGDPSAVDACLRQYGALVWSLARRLCLDHTEAEDAVQDVFIDLWKNAARFDASAASEVTFVAMIARRRLIDQRRRRQRQVPATSLVEEGIPADSDSIDQLETADEADKARKALDQLKGEQRRVLELSIYQGLSQAEIAQATSMPLGTVKTHARRGLIRLRKLLSDQEPAQQSPATNWPSH